jgi:hypothetical protein
MTSIIYIEEREKLAHSYKQRVAGFIKEVSLDLNIEVIDD